VIRRLLRAFGFVPRGELLLAEERFRGVREQLEGVTRRAEHDAERNRDAVARAYRHMALLERKLRDRESQLAATNSEEAALGAQVAAGMEALDVARGELHVIGMKLDILEGAANVLDRRLRASSVQPPHASR
jgi:hypothetical protein